MTNHNSDKVLSQVKPWVNNTNSIWLATTISLYRNIEKFHFPSNLDSTKREQIISLVSNQLLQSKLLKEPGFVKIEETRPMEKEYLLEHFLTPYSFLQHHSGEGFVLDKSGEFLATLNIDNHIQFELIEINGELEKAWNRLVKIETQIGKVINYAYSSRFGFLTQNITHCGTGFILAAFLQLSALIHTNQLNPVLDKLAINRIVLTGLQGIPKEFIGDVVVVRNNYTLGLSEEEIISIVRLFTTKLLVEENSARTRLKQEESAEIKDKVSRAFGVLIHSYQIEALEALNAISLVKLGVDLGWVEGVSLNDLNQLFFSCRQGHLLSFLGKEVSQEEIPHKRAEFIHKTLKKAQLKV